MASEWPVKTGTRTHVTSTRSPGISRILRLSSRNFFSSPVSSEPSSTMAPAKGITLCAIVAGNLTPESNGKAEPSNVRTRTSLPCDFSNWFHSSSTPSRPAPLTAWYVATLMERSPAATCNGFNTGIAAIVVQLGFATIPLGMVRRVWALTSETTRGTRGSMRHADELSITTAPEAAIRGANTLDEVAPDDINATSIPEKPAVAACSASISGPFHSRVDPARAKWKTPRRRTSTSISRPFHSRVEPADLEEAKNRISSTGNARSRRMSRITVPTCPVAPTTATRMTEVYGTPKSRLRRVEPECGVKVANRVGDLLGTDHARDSNRTGRDHLDVDQIG